MINLKKSALHPVKQIEFLGLVIDTKKMTLALSDKKLKHMSQQFRSFSCNQNLTKLIGLLPSIVSKSSTGANICSTEKGVLQWLCDTGKFSPRGTPLVDVKLETLQREKNSAPRTPYDHSDGCFNKMLGGILQGSFNRRK